MDTPTEARRVVIERGDYGGWHVGIEFPDVSALATRLAELRARIAELEGQDMDTLAAEQRVEGLKRRADAAEEDARQLFKRFTTARVRAEAAEARVRELEGFERVVKALCGRFSYEMNATWLRGVAARACSAGHTVRCSHTVADLLAAADALDALDALAAERGEATAEPEPEPEVTKYERVMAALPTPAACRIWSKAVEKKNMPYLAGMLRRLAEALESEAPAPEPPSPEARVVEAARVKWGDVTVCPTCGQPLPAAVDALPPDEEGS